MSGDSVSLLTLMPPHPIPAVFESVCRREGWPLDGNAVSVPLPGGRHQRITVEVIVEDDEELLRLHTRIGDAIVLTETRLRAAMRMNARLRLGALAIDGDSLAMVDVLLLRKADPDEVRATVLYLARKADEFELALFESDEN